MRGTLILGAVLFWGGVQAPAQETARPDSGTSPVAGMTAQVTIQADVDSALVMIDSVTMGRTPLVVKDVQPGFHRLKIIHPDVSNWLTASLHDSVQIQPGEEKVLRYTFGRRYLILSVPSGAEVFIGDSLGGSTPYLLTLTDTSSIFPITVRKSGYDSTQVNLSEARRGVQTVALKKLWATDQPGDVLEEPATIEKPNTLRIYLAAAVTVGFGAAAAYFKIQADEQNEAYLENFASPSRSQIRVYDTASAICLVVAEVGFGFLTYFLVAE